MLQCHTRGGKEKESSEIYDLRWWRDGENKHTGERQRFIPNYKAICPFLEISQNHRQLETHGDSQRKFKAKREIDEDVHDDRNETGATALRYCEKCARVAAS